MLLAFTAAWGAKGAAQAQASLGAAAASEPMQMGAPAERDAEAARDAQAGWYANALTGRDKRLQWWRDARFGCFIHWGPYSVLGGEWRGMPNPGYAEHIMRVGRIPLATYRDEVAARFRPDKFDARRWVQLIKAAGMRYIIITSKHHDGFALWPSEADSYNIRDVSHFNRDPLRELVDAARAQGLHVGFYYSHAFDWANPDAPGNDWDYDNPGGDKQLHGGKSWWNSYPQFLTNTDRYIQTKAIPQLQELIRRYHPDILWFDTPSKLPFFQQAQIVKAVRAADPDVVINGRAARSETVNLGDYLDTADRPAELRPTPGDWEAIPTTNESYGWNKLDPSHKPPGYFIQLLARAGAKGGNILLNIGPRGDGTLDPADVSILKGVADWMRVNGESVWGAQRTPLDRQSWGDSAVKGNRLFLHVLHWPPSGSLLVGGLQSEVRKVYLLQDARRAALKYRWTPERDLEIVVPGKAPDENDSVLVVESAGPVRGTPGRLIETRWGATRLLAFDADAQGTEFSYGDGKTRSYYVEGLHREGNALQWSIRATRPANVHVTLRYRNLAPGPSGPILLEHAGQKLRASLTPTADSKAIQSVELGTLRIESGALSPLTLSMPGPDRPKAQIFELSIRSVRVPCPRTDRSAYSIAHDSRRAVTTTIGSESSAAEAPTSCTDCVCGAGLKNAAH